MILSKLRDYTTRMSLPPAMYGETKIAWLISLTETGEFEGIISLKTKEAKRGKPTIAPHIGRTVAVMPKLLVDTGEYVLGMARPGSKAERVKQCHEQFKALLQHCAEITQEPTLNAILRFLNSDQLEKVKAELPKEFDPGEVMTFRVGAVIPGDAAYQIHQIEEFWKKYTASSSAEDSDQSVMTCLVTGETGAVEKRLPFLVKGLIGGQPSGTALVSANAQAFMSYGLQNSLTSPISRDAAERFTKALNTLIADERSRLYLGSTVYVYWTREPTKLNPFAALKQPEPEDIKALLSSPFSAQQASNLTDEKINQFYALALSANNARAVVRDWLETTVPNVEANIRSWFERQQMIHPFGDERRWFGIRKLAESVYRDASKEMQSSVPTALLRNALHGDRIPSELLIKLVRRNLVEHDMTYPRAVLLKLIFSSNPLRQETMTNMEQLNLEPNLRGNDRAAYYCGRLFAVLEALQRSAIGSVNASLADRYYGTASSTPIVAFTPLMRLRQAHIAKLRKTMPGACKALEERLEEILVQLPTFPKTLDLEQQGLFGLGYYHQRAHDRAAAKAAKQK